MDTRPATVACRPPRTPPDPWRVIARMRIAALRSEGRVANSGAILRGRRRTSSRRSLAKPDPLPSGFAGLHDYLAMLEAFIFVHLPPAFLHCFFVPASEISDP